MNLKYKKETLNFSTKFQDISPQVKALVSYTELPPNRVVRFPNISSFNSKSFPGKYQHFSKQIFVAHIEGGGVVDLKRNNCWKRTKNPIRKVKTFTGDHMMVVDGVLVHKLEWLHEHESLWLEEWKKWRKSISLCGMDKLHQCEDMGAFVGYGL